MGLQDFISETEASSFSGVSIATLNRFAEAGYLQIEADSDGLRLFSKSQLISLFGLQSFGDWKSPQVEQVHPSDATESNAGVSLQSTSEILSFQNEEDLQRNELRAAQTEGPTTTPVEAAPSPISLTKEVSTDTLNHVSAIRVLEMENTKLRHLSQLHEELLTLREAEIKDLKEQRDWLRVRLERMEAKSERDQILLLSESQTLRKLVSLQEERRSPIRAALDWLGFTQPIRRISDGSMTAKNTSSGQSTSVRSTASRSGTSNESKSTTNLRGDNVDAIEVSGHEVSRDDHIERVRDNQQAA